MLSTPLSIMAALILGDFSVSSGIFNAEVMLYMAFVALANYTQTNYELSYAIKFMRMLTLLLTSLFHIYGFIAGFAICLLSMINNHMISGNGYLYPLIPFDFHELKKRLVRRNIRSV
jgi:stage V sporulation protein AF